MKILFESRIGAQGLSVRVWSHDDDPTAVCLDITRHGVTESRLNDATELRLLGEAIHLAGLRLQQEGE